MKKNADPRGSICELNDNQEGMVTRAETPVNTMLRKLKIIERSR
jgi:hypothetical protein